MQQQPTRDDYLFVFNSLRLAVKAILIESTRVLLPWELWRTGMLRLDLNETSTLHVWSPRHRDADVTMIHDHPFNLRSLIVAGELENVRYMPSATYVSNAARLFWQARIRCGVDARRVDEPRRIYLTQSATREILRAGDVYSQSSDEIHQTVVTTGAVTVVSRSFVTRNRDDAHVYIENGKEWGDAKPRAATADEAAQITSEALDLF